MASVWVARMHGTRGFQKVVAVKTLLPGMSEDTDFETMLLDEARLASRIRHPHVVEILDVGEEDGILYIVMEWVHGITLGALNRLSRERGGIPLPLALKIASSCAAGLHAAHELKGPRGEEVNLVHRDVSPANVMVSFNGIVKLVDFGIAKAAGRLYQTRAQGLMKGKIPYMSPEQLEAQPLDRRSDIFSLGILMYVLLTGRHPFRGPDDHRTMENILHRAVVPLREVVESIPPVLETIVVRALEKDPAERWQTGLDLQRALDSLAQSLGYVVTEADLQSFVEECAGATLAAQSERVVDAIEEADARGSVLPPAVALRQSSAPPPVAPLAAEASVDRSTASGPPNDEGTGTGAPSTSIKMLLLAAIICAVVGGGAFVFLFPQQGRISPQAPPTSAEPLPLSTVTPAVAPDAAPPAPSASSPIATDEPPEVVLDLDEPRRLPSPAPKPSSPGVAPGLSPLPIAPKPSASASTGTRPAKPTATAVASAPAASPAATSAPKAPEKLKSAAESQPDF